VTNTSIARASAVGPLLVALLVAGTASAQSPLSLSAAVARAKARNPDAAIAASAEREADERLTQARGGYFPRVDVEEAWQRGNHPVFVFSSLLAQRQFTAAGFTLDALNHPSAITSFRMGLAVEQSLFDRTTAAGVRTASIARDMAATGRRLVDEELTAAVSDAFGRVLTAVATIRSAAAMVETARADRELAGNRRDAGKATDADVLQVDLYLARMLEQQVQAVADESVASARLNQLMGEPLSATFSLEDTPPVVAIDTNTAGLEEDALKHRPEVSLAVQQEELAAAAVDAARATFLLQVSAQFGWELNGESWHSRSPSWVGGVVARINLFRGLADKARLREAREQATRRALETDRAETLARLDVRIAVARLEAARASEAVGRAAVEQAQENRRIIRNRYESGLTDAAMLLRSAEAVQQAEAQQIAARVSVLTATATLQRAIGKP
jgi:outer membrane protein TolC